MKCELDQQMNVCINRSRYGLRDGPGAKGTSMAEIGAIFTLQEASARLRVSERMICKTARAHGLCSRVGRTYLFSEEDIVGIWNALRAKSLASHPTSKPSAAQVPVSAHAAYAELLKHVIDKKKGKGTKR